MSRCTHFRDHLALDLSAPLSDALREHLDRCPECRALYERDQALESQLRRGFEHAALPGTLMAGVRINVAHARRRNGGVKRWAPWFPPALAAALVLFFVLVPFPGRFSSVEEVSALAVADHHEKQEMMFQCEDPKSASWWFESRLDFTARVPRLEQQGYRFVGGRTCELGGREVASLFYEKEGKRVSLFILDRRDVDFEVVREITYCQEVESCRIKIWEDGGSVYVMVE